MSQQRTTKHSRSASTSPQAHHHEELEAHLSERVLEQIANPTHRGRMSGADAQAIFTGWCGDTMAVYVRLAGATIREAKFTTDGCGPAIACGNMLMSMVEGLAVDEATAIEPAQLIHVLDGLPEATAHCAELAVKTLRRALNSATTKRTGGPL